MGEVRPDGGAEGVGGIDCDVLELVDLLLLLRQSFLMLFTDIIVPLFCDFEARASSPLRESAEKRLVVPDRARPLTGCSGTTSGAAGCKPFPIVIVSHWGPDICKLCGGSGDDGCRPKGSGDRGITGDTGVIGAEPWDWDLGGRILAGYNDPPSSSSSSFFRRSLSEGPVDGVGLG